MSRPTLFITGASGFLGRALTLEALSRELPVARIARSPLPPLARTTDIALHDYSELKQPDGDAILVHLAESNVIAPAACSDANRASRMRFVLQTLLSKRWRHVVYISSAAVYGDNQSYPRRPNEVVAPQNFYGTSKAENETRVLASGGTVVRVSNVYGPTMSRANVVSKILRQIPASGPLYVRDKNPVRDFLWIEDAARGLASIAEAATAGIFNLGTGVGTSVGDLALTALACAGDSDRPVIATVMSDGVSHLVVDIADTCAKIGWQPTISVRQGIARLVPS